MSLLETPYLKFELMADAKAILVTATKNFIPGEAFRAAFNEALPKLEEAEADRMVFDKRNLSVFDQEAMTWYHVEWKPQAYEAGIIKHVKLLPKNEVFRKSVEIGKQRITRENPAFEYAKYQISYSDSLEEALGITKLV